MKIVRLLSISILLILFFSFTFSVSISAQGNCDAEANDFTQLVDAINQANDEAACPGLDTITLTNDLTVDTPASDDNYGEVGANAFPVITSDIAIVGAKMDETRTLISRNADAPAFRFFYVDARNDNGSLTLDNITLSGGNAVRGGAIYVDGTSDPDSTITHLTITNSLITDNQATAGTIMLGSARAENLTTRASISSSIIENNQVSQQGGAIYLDARSSGMVDLELANTRIVRNSANTEGGALYNQQAGGAGITINATDTDFFFNTQGRGDTQCFNNGGGVTFAANTSNRSTGTGCGDSLVVTEAEAEAILATPLRVLGTGEVQVTLSWDNASDMDLAVTDPNNDRIFHGQTTSASGGELDVDSNYPCGNNPAGIENVVWEESAPAGTYTVELGMFDLCGSSANPNWSLTVRLNGQIVLEEQGNETSASFTFEVANP